jgi:hypothetical protein
VLIVVVWFLSTCYQPLLSECPGLLRHNTLVVCTQQLGLRLEANEDAVMIDYREEMSCAPTSSSREV